MTRIVGRSSISLRWLGRSKDDALVAYRHQCQVVRWKTGYRFHHVNIRGQRYATDEWMNTPENVVSASSRLLHLQNDHPLSITRRIIESHFNDYKCYNDLHPAVTVAQNFDALGFPADHPGRSKTDTYYVNKSTVLRTHTSAHQADIFNSNQSDGWLISADVYRRDAIDRSHYPVFHQMEGAMTWDRAKLGGSSPLISAIQDDLQRMPKHDVDVDDPNPATHIERNPLQSQYHTEAEVQVIASHLKRSLELVMADIFRRAESAARLAGVQSASNERLRMRWVEAYFPFTSPSWELEVLWQGEWLEVLGCGVVKQELLNNAGVPDRLGWAFGLGLERIAMLLFSIPDIRLFWSRDARFLSQFLAPASANRDGVDQITPYFKPFSKHPACYKDVTFWLPDASGGTSRQQTEGGAAAVHENDVMEVVRDVGGDDVEDVTLLDDFTHPKTGRKSLCYRVNYRSLERTLTNEEANDMHDRVRSRLVEKLGVELR